VNVLTSSKPPHQFDEPVQERGNSLPRPEAAHQLCPPWLQSPHLILDEPLQRDPTETAHTALDAWSRATSVLIAHPLHIQQADEFW